MSKRVASSNTVDESSRKDTETVTESSQLPPGWVLKKSRSRGGLVYYYNTVTGISTWIKPISVTEAAQGTYMNTEKEVKQNDKKASTEMKPSALSLISLHYQKNKVSTPSSSSSGYSKKQKAEKTTQENVVKHSTVHDNSIPEYQQAAKSKTESEKSKKSESKKQIVGSSSNEKIKGHEQKVNKKPQKRQYPSDLPIVNETIKETHNSSSLAIAAETKPSKKIAKARRKNLISRPSYSSLQNVSNNSNTLNTEVKDASGENSYAAYKKVRCNNNNISSTNPSNDNASRKDKLGQADELSCNEVASRGINSSHIATKPQAKTIKHSVKNDISTDDAKSIKYSSKNDSSTDDAKNLSHTIRSDLAAYQRKNIKQRNRSILSKYIKNIKQNSTHDLTTHNTKSLKQNTICGLSTHNTKSVKQSSGSDLSTYESLLLKQSSYNRNDLINKNEIVYQARSSYSSNINTSLPSLTDPDRVDGLYSLKNSSLRNDNRSPELHEERKVNNRSQNNIIAATSTPNRLPDLDIWHSSSENISWKTDTRNSIQDLGNPQVGNCSLTRQQPSPTNEGEQDIEDMEVDEEGLVILSNLQDARVQISSVPDKPSGFLIETVIPSVTADSVCIISKCQVMLVVDTNILISCLLFLRDVLNYNIPGYEGVTLVLPWVVMQELDFLKNGKGSINNLSVSTSQRAAKAVKFIHSHLVDRNSHLIGQTPVEACKDSELPVECNDDRILQCCLQFQQKYAGSQVVLLTRDMNLINKAMIMGLKAASNETLWSCLNVPKPLLDKKRVSSEQRLSSTETSNTSKIMLKNINEIESSHGNSYIQKTVRDKFKESPKIENVSRDSPTMHNRSVLLTAGSSLHEKTLPTEDANSTLAKVITDEKKRVPQTETEKIIIMNKFEAVWKLIYDIKSQIGPVLSDGKCHVNYNEAVQLLHVIIPLLTVLKDDFLRCLSLSPVILWEHEYEFKSLCVCLNTFYTQAQNSCNDPSQPIETLQLMNHFCESCNRSLLLAGLEQLSSFITDLNVMFEMCS